MRVLFLTNNPNLGSTARVLQSWIQIGRRSSLESWVVGQRAGDFTKWLQAEGVPLLVDPMPWPDRWWPVPSLSHAWRVARWARRAAVEIIHCNEHDVYPFGWMLRRLLRLPLVCHVRFRIEGDFSRWAFGRPRRMPDALLWTSNQQRRDCSGAVKGIVPIERQHLVPLGLDLNQFGTRGDDRESRRSAWGIRPEQIVLGTATYLSPRKRVEDFIKLVERLGRENDAVVGLIAGRAVTGEQAYEERIKELVWRSPLGRRLRWLGHLEPVEPFYHACDIFISTSEYETFGNSVCEAMACQRAVAAYCGGSICEVVGEAGLVAETGDLDGLVAQVQRLVENGRLRSELGGLARERVAKHYNAEGSLRQLQEIYRSLIDCHSVN